MTVDEDQTARPAAASPELEGRLGFGAVFTRHVVAARYADGGWSGATLQPFEAISLSPASMVLHYGQAIFEGLKAFRAADGSALIFRAADCARRFRRSAARMGMPELPEDVFVEAVRAVVAEDVDQVPSAPGCSLYVRPVMFAAEPSLAVRASTEYVFLVVASPVDSFFAAGRTMIDVFAMRELIRAARGGTGDVKCAGNYAAAMVAKSAAVAQGYDEVLWLDAVEHRYVEEFGAMNCFAVTGRPDDGTATLVTPPLAGTILPGHTRATVLTLAARRGIPVVERPLALDELTDPDGSVTEVFAAGTAAGIAPVRTVGGSEGVLRKLGDEPGPVTAALAADYAAVVRGAAPAEDGWLIRVPG
ncbi:branched-chain amino acid aminotransferase [Friedmanniella endophytica]|uniref:Branched-chain amino acid aminotransferase n=1 Tax=Microlunatus kandeliicorticis TaxID=1759536 RepID=A0A7W3IQU4_9ACTN|nr:branched-chain amino acid aminotransferase [Microlunatus kandeliicorticis]MBA8793571.1 branched-chain amino acid aminotransferase [Microlunatus kandeliicorticis]